jgi:hypothetical protein
MHKCVIIGGGTFSHVAAHLALAAPAFGTTAKTLKTLFEAHKMLDVVLKLTKMADSSSDLVTNEDVRDYVFSLILDKDVRIIVLNAALCDFKMSNPTRDKRLSSKLNYNTKLMGVTEKVITEIKKYRPDIIVVGFKTTAGEDIYAQLDKAENLVRQGIDFVVANDIEKRVNFSIDSRGSVTGGPRSFVLGSLVSDCIREYKELVCCQYA